MHKTLGAILESESQDVLSTQILYRAFKKQDSKCLSLKKKGKCDKKYVERLSKSLHQRREIKIITLGS